MISIRGNAISGAILYADGTTNNTGTLSYQWKADGTDLAGENGQFYATEKSCLGKQISVTVVRKTSGTIFFYHSGVCALITDHFKICLIIVCICKRSPSAGV